MKFNDNRRTADLVSIPNIPRQRSVKVGEPARGSQTSRGPSRKGDGAQPLPPAPGRAAGTMAPPSNAVGTPVRGAPVGPATPAEGSQPPTSRPLRSRDGDPWAKVIDLKRASHGRKPTTRRGGVDSIAPAPHGGGRPPHGQAAAQAPARPHPYRSQQVQEIAQRDYAASQAQAAQQHHAAAQTAPVQPSAAAAQAPAQQPYQPYTAPQQQQHAPSHAYPQHGAAPMQPPPTPPAGPLGAPMAAESKWAVFEKLGLKPENLNQQNAVRMLVTAYRGLGFLILTIIVVVLVGYISTSAFYFVSNSWVQPMVVSPTDEQVLQLSSELAAQENLRDQIAADLDHTERFIASQQDFQEEFVKAVEADLLDRRRALSRLHELARSYDGAREKIARSNRAYARHSRRKMAQEYSARLIDRADYLSGNFQLAQIANSNLSLAERQAELEARAEALEGETRALAAVVSHDESETGALGYDVLQIKRDYDRSRLETAKALADQQALRASLARHDAILESIRKSPYLRASSENANIAFVPYDNMSEVEVGTELYGCALEMVFCGQVGKVVDIFPGEVTFKHPHREKALRGQMIEIELEDEDADAAHDDVLFAGGRPLLL